MGVLLGAVGDETAGATAAAPGETTGVGAAAVADTTDDDLADCRWPPVSDKAKI